ncbi:pollen receptor-like kinase 1 [Punica granatum]|uniref:non-specific serine/threonine protein kinase n=2 Tax=Punica granatum TaxID=22663 RepID=A0A218XPI2_PUNGR|nr:pollen receptor-like kinase 1 [Punica granatum]OWM86897.1 hypothetical protein CDL15_Pgr015933 [Punica granatum]PKI37585.1 hypothetical protein CRG98_042009 [Punica granatum]
MAPFTFHHHPSWSCFSSYNHRCSLFLMIAALVVAYSASPASSNANTDSAVLLKFKSSIKDPSGVLSSWNASRPTCTKEDFSFWTGVLCYQGSVWGLQLENMDLSGTIDVDSLVSLKSLRTLSFKNNSFEGPIPTINRLGALKALYLSDNLFSGEIPNGAFDGMLSLKKLHLAHNQFTGKIPGSLVLLPRLLELRMEDNQFTGQIPDFQQKKLLVVNLSGNSLEGPIPARLSKLDPSSFSGNKALCSAPLAPCPSPSPPPSATPPPSRSSGMREPPSYIAIIVIAIVLGVALLIVLVVLIYCARRRRNSNNSLEAPTPSNLQRKASLKGESNSRMGSPEHSGSSKKGESTKLSFVRDDRERFDLQDLLKASAEILGSGCFGSSYKAALTSGTMMVVKRFRQMNNVGKEEFQEHMRRLGRLTHPNLLPLVAYYYRKEEKLLVSDFVSRGSLAVHLHSNHARGQPALDWPTRLKIVKGVARGLSYLYAELPTLITPHGHLKSSNVLLNDCYEPLLNDYGLVPVINQESSEELMVAYKSPEYLQHARITKKTDVWSLGMLILEILTGKFPANFLQKGHASDEDEDLVKWVKTVEGSNEVFDKEMKASPNSEGEMTKLLKIGLACCEAEVEKRMELKDVVEKIEEVKEKETEDDFYSSYASEADVRSSRGLSDEIRF